MKITMILDPRTVAEGNMLSPTLLISRNISQSQINTLKLAGVHCIDWFSSRFVKLSDYEVIIIDTRVDMAKGLFRGLRADLETLLEAGGILFVLAGPTQRMDAESNYDFLPKDMLVGTNLMDSESREGSRFDVKEQKWQSYFSLIPKYWKTVDEINRSEHGAKLEYYDSEALSPASESAQIHATTKVTSEVIGCLINWKGGTVGILPPPTEDLITGSLLLQRIGSDIYKRNIAEVGECKPPTWVVDYVTAEEQELWDRKDKLIRDLDEVRQRLRHFALTSSCLYSTGTQLERAVKALYSDLEWSFDDLTKKGEPVDYVVHGQDTSHELLLALTGTNGYIDANHKKIAQLFGALAIVKDNQRLVFLVNPLAEDDPRSRTVERCITSETLKRLTRHGICVLLVHDLYKLWRDRLDGRISSGTIFESLYETRGLFKHPGSGSCV